MTKWLHNGQVSQKEHLNIYNNNKKRKLCSKTQNKNMGITQSNTYHEKQNNTQKTMKQYKMLDRSEIYHKYMQLKVKRKSPESMEQYVNQTRFYKKRKGIPKQ